jgi:hypothetical protein
MRHACCVQRAARLRAVWIVDSGCPYYIADAGFTKGGTKKAGGVWQKAKKNVGGYFPFQ